MLKLQSPPTSYKFWVYAYPPGTPSGTATSQLPIAMATCSADPALALELCERYFESMLDRMLLLRLDSPRDTSGGLDLASAIDQLGTPDVLAQPAATAEHDRQISSGSASSTASTNGTEWLETLVSEMASAASMDDARCRAARFLEAFQGSVAARVVGDKERVLEGQNAILKKAVVVQHRRHLQDKARCKELQGQVTEYQEQIRLLELENYSLSMHLRIAQTGGYMSGSFHPEVF